MATGPLTGTRYAVRGTRPRSERRFQKWVAGLLAPTRSVTNRHATNPDGTTDGKDAGGTGGRFPRQLPGQQQCGSAAANPMMEEFAGRTRRASFIRPPRDIAFFDLAAMDAS